MTLFSSVETKTLKLIIFLFSCLFTRAVHLEVTELLFTAHRLATIRHFVTERGLPGHLVSYNGSIFNVIVSKDATATGA